MTKINNISEIDKIIRAELAMQSGVNLNYIRNSITIYGADLNKNTSQSIWQSIDHNDTMIIFAVHPANNGNNMSETEKDGSISYYKAYTVHIIMYGDNTPTLSNVLAARLRTEEARNNLQNKGIYLASVTDSEEITEFVNGAMWVRNDFDISIACQMSIQPVSPTGEFLAYTETNIYTI